MRQLFEFLHEGNRTLFAGLLAAIFFAGLIVVAGPTSMDQRAFAGEPPPVDQALAAENMPSDPGEKGGPPKDCDDPPVTCVGVNVADLPFPGCTSGQRCSLSTTGKTCGMLNSGKRCQTVNNGSGVCACQCMK